MSGERSDRAARRGPLPVRAGVIKDYRDRVVDTDDGQRRAVCDGSTRAAMDHVRARLADEFGARVSVGDITRYVAQAHADLAHMSPAALPELVERLARIRLLDRSRA